MYNPSFDLVVLSAMQDDFDVFIKSDIVFWQLSDPGHFLARFPKMTVGGLMLYWHRLAALRSTLSTGDQMGAAQLLDGLEAQIASWQANLERKALAEVNTRFNSWTWYLDDCDDSPSSCERNYPSEVYARVYLKFLFDVLKNNREATTGRERLKLLDARLRKTFRPGSFVWDEAVKPAFPEDEFWFLHGWPRV